MFSVAKILDANPKNLRFLTTTLFVYQERTHRLAVIQIAVIDKELIGSDLGGCANGPATFDWVLHEIQKMLDVAQEGTRMIYKEHVPKIEDVDDFAVEHLWPYLDRTSVMGTHEDVAEMLRKCFPKK